MIYNAADAVFYIVVKIITKTYLGNNKKEF